MAQSSARRAALAALRNWRTRGQLADSIIADVLRDAKLQAADRAFALELFYGVVRNLTLLDFWIGRLRDANVDVDLRDILRLGLYQLLIAKVPEHAAVFESVELAPKNHRGFINGVLRAAARQRDKLEADAEHQSLSIRSSHPDFLIERWGKNLGAEATIALCHWNNQPPSVYARINRLKINREEFLETYPDARALPGVPGFVEFATTFPTDALNRGHCYIQDPSTRMACDLLDPQAGEKILDACAAPGGKTSYIGEQMTNNGLILACDRQSSRLSILEENLERLGGRMARTVRHDWMHANVPAAITDVAPFDRILVDAPCSNTGVMRRRVDLRWRLQPEEFLRMQEEQLSILRAVVPLLKLDGVLVYSTCSLEPEENRTVVERLVKEMSILQLMQEKDCLPFRDRFDGAYVAKLSKLHPRQPMEP